MATDRTETFQFLRKKAIIGQVWARWNGNATGSLTRVTSGKTFSAPDPRRTPC